MAKHYPKGWKKTPDEINRLWSEVDAIASGITMNIARRNLIALKNLANNLKRIVKILERVQVADAIDSAK